MSYADEAARVGAPQEGGVIRLNITTASQRFEIPPAFAGMQCQWVFWPDVDNNERVEVTFGDSAVAVTAGQQSSVSTETITVNDASGMTLFEQVPISFPMPPIGTLTHFAAIGSAAGNLEIIRG